MPDNPEIAEFLHAVERRLHACVTGAVAEQLQLIDPELDTFAQVSLSAVTAGGKRLRPRFAFGAWRLGSTDPQRIEAIVALAASLELLHAAILVHDDIIDHSDLRRGRPSARAALAGHHRDRDWWGAAQEFGDGSALLVGDLLWSAAHDEFDDMTATLAPPLRRQVARCFRSMRVEVISGQLLELRAQAARDYRPDTAAQIQRYKTGSYTVVRPVELGTILTGSPAPAVTQPLRDYAVAVGQAFQLRDDLADLFSPTESTGKQPGDDIRTGKPTELLGATLAMATAAEALSLAPIVGDAAADDDRIADTQRIALRSGAVGRTRGRIDGLVATAEQALSRLPATVDPAGRAELARLLTECTDLCFLPAG
ncbi:polyprenyl synthetase family protein [Mycobacterium sp. AMU20-3851]|uniref:polyprenyl synthetase family protein n=1 Tax=Mycobacterium sp. AMU20-3851 TaxID=3122055 RepID=UPI0037549164